MKLVTTELKKIPDTESVYSVGIAVDSDICYAALVDIKTHKNYVEEVSLSPTKEKFTGMFKRINNEETWRVVCAFFNVQGVFDKFWKGKNWKWEKKDGVDNIPDWFRRQRMSE